MKIMKISGNKQPKSPKRQVDAQIIKKKNAFNLKEYKLAYVDDTGSKIEGIDMSQFTIPKLEAIKVWLEEKHPTVNWTLETVKEWINKNFIGKPKPLQDPQDLEHHF